MSNIENKQENNGDITIINVNGALDSNSSAAFEKTVNDLFNQNQKYIGLDCSKVDYISSTGIGALLFASKRINSLSGAFALFEVQKDVYSLMKILKIDIFFEMFENKETAIDYLSSELDRKMTKSASAQDRHPLSPPSQASESETVEKENTGQTNKPPVIYDAPLIVECAECGNYVRIHQSGDYICPTCHTEFSAKRDGTVVF